MCNLSVIIPAYNAENYVVRCLDSIIGGIDIDEFEIILVDDGSTDKTMEIASNYAKNKGIDYLMIIHQNNARQGAARNNGMSKAKGKYILFVDVDDYIAPIGIKRFIQYAERENIDIMRFAFKEFDSEGNYTIRSDKQFEECRIYTGIEAILKGYTIGSICGILFNRTFLMNAGICFREDMAHEDCDFILRLLPKAERIINSFSCLYTYCWNYGSTDRDKSVTNILRLKQSDIFVAKSYFETADTIPIDNPVNKYYYRKANSVIIQFLLSLINNNDGLSLNEKMRLLDFATFQGVYPMRSFRTLSWKTTFLKLFLNCPYIEKILIRLFNRVNLKL